MPDFVRLMDWELSHTLGLLVGGVTHYHPATGHSLIEQCLAFIVCVGLPPALVLNLATIAVGSMGLAHDSYHVFFPRRVPLVRLK